MEQQSLSLTRIFNAPRELVFSAWTDSIHLERWWAPKGFTNVIHVWALQPGGEILLDMIAPDTTVYPMSGTFKEITPPSHLVFISTPLGNDGKPLFEALNTVSFMEEGGKTKLMLEVVVSNITPAAAPHLAGMETGWNQSLDRLTELLLKI